MTELEYLNDTYLFESTATFLEEKSHEQVTSGTNTKSTAIILNKTIFYPQGGGQPADQGVISCGGTHVNSTSEIGKITIRKIKCKKGNTKIAYVVG